MESFGLLQEDSRGTIEYGNQGGNQL